MRNLKDYKIGVLKGGVSGERDISLASGREVYLALKRQGIYSEEIDITTNNISDVKKILRAYNIDIAFIALHGEFGEDGRIQKVLEEMNILYTGSGPEASRRAMDKIVSKEIFLRNNIPTPGYFVLNKSEPIPEPRKLPKVVKPHYSGSSIGVFITDKAENWRTNISNSLEVSGKVIVEDYIAGREFTVGILDDTPKSVVEIVPKSAYFDFTTKYSDGMAELKAPAPLAENDYDRIMKIAERSHKAIGCSNFSRVDVRMDAKGNIFVLEVNSIPGLTAHSLLPLSAKVRGIEFDTLIITMLKSALKDGRKQKQENQQKE